MNKNNIALIFIFFALLNSCNNKGKQLVKNSFQEVKNEDTDNNKQTFNVVSKTRYCYIEKIFKRNKKTFIICTYVDFLIGEKALQKAIQNGDADYEINKDGDTIHFLNTDHYISNQNKKSVTLELISDIKIELWNYHENNNLFNKVSIQELENYLQNNPIIILKIKNGIVIEMKEQYVP